MPENLQLSVLKILTTKTGWSRYRDLITHEIIPSTDFRLVYGAIERAHRTTEGDVSRELLRLEFEASRVPEETYRVLDRIPEEVPDGAEKTIQRWAEHRWYEKAAEHVASPDFKPEVHADFVARAVAARTYSSRRALSIHDTTLPGVITDRNGLVPLGISTRLDYELGGGASAGELVIILAPPDRGKTSVLCASGASMAAGGHHPLHISLERNLMHSIRRYENTWTGLTKTEMIHNPEAVKNARKVLRGEVWFEDLAHQRTNCAAIGRLVEMMRSENAPIDVLIIDYLEKLTPNPRREYYRLEERHAYGRITDDACLLASQLKIPIISAWQGNRASWSSLELDATNFSESFEPVKDASTIIALNQGVTEARRNEMRLGVLKHKHSRNRPVIKIHADFDRNIFRDLDDETNPA